jgi:hypothetical protein
MSFVSTQPEALAAAAGDLGGIAAGFAARNSAAAGPTTGVVPASADEVSAAAAAQFNAHGTLYQQIAAQAAAFQQMFVETLHGSAGTYAVAEAANVAAAG